jgi:hypothetical protein
MKNYTIIIFLLISLGLHGQVKKTFQVISDTTKFVGIDAEGNQLILKNGTENRKKAFLKNKENGLVEFDFAVDSVWVVNDTLFIQRALLHKFKLNSSEPKTYLNGVNILNDTVRYGGELTNNTTIKLNGYDYVIKQDSGNYYKVNSNSFISQRLGLGSKTIFEQRDNSFNYSILGNDIVKSSFLLNDTISRFKYEKSKIELNDQRILYDSKQHYFSGDWLKIPQKNQTQLDSNQLFRPSGSLIYNTNTKGLYVSDGSTMSPSAIEYLDGNEIQTVTPVAWANGAKIPLLRIRHPKNVTGLSNSLSIDRDFKIIPYEYGMALEYNGVFENWVGEFSIHKGVNYHYLGDGDGWGGVLWVGDDHDSGGLRLTARNSTFVGGNTKWTEISSEQFTSFSAGNLRFRLVDSTDRIDFVTGKRGSQNVYGFINTTGIKFPSVNIVNNILSPVKGLTVFDDSDSTMKIYNGVRWDEFTINRRINSDTINTSKILSYKVNQIQYVNASNGDITITLPAIVNNISGLIFKIIRTDNSSNRVIIVVNWANTINGVNSKTIQNQFECMNLYSNSVGEWIATKELGY